MNWEEYLFAGAVIALGLLFAGMMLIEYLTSEQARADKRKYWLIPLACILALTRAHGGQTIKDSVSVREAELNGFERHDEVVLTTTKPLYRLGEILQTSDGRFVVTVDYHFTKGQWWYDVVEVKVGQKK